MNCGKTGRGKRRHRRSLYECICEALLFNEPELRRNRRRDRDGDRWAAATGRSSTQQHTASSRVACAQRQQQKRSFFVPTINREGTTAGTQVSFVSSVNLYFVDAVSCYAYKLFPSSP
ncbi:hypothetical protein Tcan_10226 [Toxocara canis]|uniref:Uncharacterized protein n=1 Tax=Toxocara canis TaxID=6265 RepID=A0A0B2UMQ2_TOXCA|nr:hypothetical protein Tcan_10226 [Toxocara canis]